MQKTTADQGKTSVQSFIENQDEVSSLYHMKVGSYYVRYERFSLPVSSECRLKIR